MDLDGNDLHFTLPMLKLINPKLLCVEYNGNFPPPISLCLPYEQNFAYGHNDYYGATLQAWVDALESYTLVSCDASGVNAFFVRKDLMAPFIVYQTEMLYQRPRYWLSFTHTGHHPSFGWLKNALGEPIS